ncbi:MAG: molybdenum cofactor biosynthesis protein MoaE [Gammaproteobacteria bacterium SHHR-1]|uniref:molybdenum cofactor biosynthesis protein MoaE n=1 Tax=Magnetovirga frankeli TaxID=947516 RepID=UPI001294148B|nr:molybdenum cofactor biosynthesis protein MoaE [gamma proteobacterium SS-5]
MNEILILEQPLDPEAEQLAFRRGRPAAGALVGFLGLMRDINQDDAVQAMRLEHYPGMTEKALARIIRQAQGRWPLEGVRVIHRVGPLLPEDPIVLVLVAARHRGEAFQACEFIIDYLKTQAPFWKQETLADGSQRWVDGRHSDTQAMDRWAATESAPAAAK